MKMKINMEKVLSECLVIFWILSVTSAATTAPTLNQKFIIEPESLSSQIGSTVFLPCKVENKQGVLQWTKDDFGLGTHRNLSAFDRYSMIGSDEDGNHTLRIESLQLEDDAKYQCQVSPGPQGQPGIRSRFATLTVLVPPELPKITQGDFLLTTENKEIELECISYGGKPIATLTWIDGSGATITSGIKNAKEQLDDGKRFTAKSTLKLKAQREHHNTTITCQAKSMPDKTIKTAEVKIEVHYTPKLKMKVIKDNATRNTAVVAHGEEIFLEGSEAHFQCIGDANPRDVQYKWFINNELVVGDYTTEMMIYSVNRSHHTAVVKCEATNEIGTTSKTTILNVTYAPIFKEAPKSIEADTGEKVNLACDVDGNPLEIIWVYDPIDKINKQPTVINNKVGSKRNLKVTVSRETAGRYICKASVAGFPEIQAAANVYLKQAPKITSPQQQYGVIGDTLRLECFAISIPKARHISWSFKGREINTSGDHEFSILEDPSAQGVKSTLVIRNSQAWHFDKYNCSVVNDYGTDVLQIDLLQSDTILRQIRNNLPIFLTISITFVMILIVIVCFICIKTMGRKARETKKEKEFSHHDNYVMNYPDDNSGIDKCCKDSDRSSPSSDYKIKQSSSESNYSLPSTVSDNTLMQIISNGGVIPYEKPVAYRQSINYGDEEAYYASKDGQGSYGSITAVKNRRSMDYDDDRYYISNNIRNSGYGLSPNPNPNINYLQHPQHPQHQQKHIVTPNYGSNRYVSHPKHYAQKIDPRQEVGIPTRSSIV